MPIADREAALEETTEPRIGRYSVLPGTVKKRRFTMFDVCFVGQMLLMGLFYSQTLSFLPHVATTVALYVILLGNIAFAAFCLPKNLGATAFSAIAAAILIFYMALFSVHFDTKMTGALIASFPGLLAGGVFGLSMAKNGLEKTLHLFFVACLLYAFSFIIISLRLDAGSLTSMHKAHALKEAGSVMLSHSKSTDSGNQHFRIKVAGAYFVFGMLYPLQQLREKFSLSYAAGFLFLAACIAKSDFRFLLGAAALAAIVMLTPFKVRTKATLAFCFVMVVLVGFATCAAFFLNPFELLRVDSTNSGFARAAEGRQALDIIHRFPFFGTGLISQAEDAPAAYGGSFMAPSDIGTFGIMLQYGLMGLGLALLSNFLIYRMIKRMSESRQVSQGAQNVVLGFFVFTTLFEVISTSLLEGEATLLIALAVSYLALARSQKVDVPWRGGSSALRYRKTPASPKGDSSARP